VLALRHRTVAGRDAGTHLTFGMVPSWGTGGAAVALPADAGSDLSPVQVFTGFAFGAAHVAGGDAGGVGSPRTGAAALLVNAFGGIRR